MKTSSTQGSIVLATHWHLLTFEILKKFHSHIFCVFGVEKPSFISKSTSTDKAGYTSLDGSLQRRSGNRSVQDQIHHEYIVQFG